MILHATSGQVSMFVARRAQLLRGALFAAVALTAGLLPSLASAQTATPNVGGLGFTEQPTGTTSAARQITITNTGVATLNISSVSLGGANVPSFGSTNTCGSPIAAGGQCAVSVTFAPTSVGAKSATVIIKSNSTGGTLTLGLSGTGVSPTAGLTAGQSSLAFGNQEIGLASFQAVLITNTTAGSVTVKSVTLGGANVPSFGSSNNCSTALAPGGQCTVSVSFTPTAAGAKSASITVSSTAASPTTSITLTGTGYAPTAGLTLTPSSLAFGNQEVTVTSAAKTITVTNTTAAAVTVHTVSVGGANAPSFATNNTCSGAVPVEGTCAVSVTFDPAGVGAKSASVNVASSAASSLASVTLAGTGVAPTTTLTVSPLSVSFGNEPVGTTSAAQLITVTNTTGASVTVNTVSITGANTPSFASTKTCSSPLAVGASCTVSVTFAPAGAGSKSAQVNIASSGSSSPAAIGLTGTGVAATTALTANPSSVSFGNQVSGTHSAAQLITVTNTTAATVTINTVTVIGANVPSFASSNTCGVALMVEASCTVSVTFGPTSAGAKSASISIASTASSSPTLVSMTGTGTLLVPNVVGLTQAAAGTAITAAGLTVGTITMASSSVVPSGDVISENPPAGTGVAASSAVNLTVSTGSAPVIVPNVVDETQAAATTALTGVGLTVGTITTASSASVPAGEVISESPAAGTSVAGGSAVNLTVSLGANSGVGTGVGWFPFTAAPVASAMPAGQAGLFVLPNTPLSISPASVNWVISGTPVQTVGAAFVLQTGAQGTGFWPYLGIYAALNDSNVVELYSVLLTNASASAPAPTPIGNFTALGVTALDLICDNHSTQSNILDPTSWFLVIHVGGPSGCGVSTATGDSWVVVTASSTTSVNIATTDIQDLFSPTGTLTGLVLNDPATNNIYYYTDKSFTSPSTLFTGATTDSNVLTRSAAADAAFGDFGTVQFRELGNGTSNALYRLDYSGPASFAAVPSYNPGTDSLTSAKTDGTNFYFTDTNFSTSTETLYQEALDLSGSTPAAPIALYGETGGASFSLQGSNGSVVILSTTSSTNPAVSNFYTVPVGTAHTGTPTLIVGPFNGTVAATTQFLGDTDYNAADGALYLDLRCSTCVPPTEPYSTEIFSPSGTVLAALTTDSVFLQEFSPLGGYILQIRGVTDLTGVTEGGGTLYGVPTGDNVSDYTGLAFQTCTAFSGATCSTTGNFVLGPDIVLGGVFELSTNWGEGLMDNPLTGVYYAIVANVNQQEIGFVTLTNTTILPGL